MNQPPSPSSTRPSTRTMGALVVSLDFELFWGIHDSLGLTSYRDNLLGAREAIPRILELFEEFGIHATWATVGFLFFAQRDALLAALPAVRPAYSDPRLSPYQHLSLVGGSEADAPIFLGRSLIERIRNVPHQEIGTHTFSHYYCLEPGQSISEFRADLSAAVGAAAALGIEMRSIVFPRHQYSPEHVRACAEAGITVFRGTELSWLYAPRPFGDDHLGRRATRLLDTYVNLTGHHTIGLEEVPQHGSFNVRASRFLRAYSRRLALLDGLRRRRITSALSHAAHHGHLYHLWWHPHNFGRDLEQNLAFLRSILEHYRVLSERAGMRSLSMGEVATEVRGAHGVRPLPSVQTTSSDRHASAP